MTIGAAAAVLALLAACGAPPDYQYVASSDRSIVVKLPRSWKAVDSADVGATNASGQWVGFYDAADQPGATHFFDELPITAPDAPVVRLLSVKIDPKTVILDDDLRDVFAPNTPHELAKFEMKAVVDDTKLVGYQKLIETAVDTKTASGLRIVSGYAFEKDPSKDRLVAAGVLKPDGNAPTVVLDKLVLVAKDNRHLHVIAVWCSLICFRENQKQIENVVDSYTVKLQQ